MFNLQTQTVAAALLQIICLFNSLSAQAEVNSFHYDKGAISGKRSIFGASMELDINCNSIKSEPPRIIEAPKHGNVILTKSFDYPRFNIENPHYKCISKKYPATSILYQSEPQFKGKDRFVIEDISSLGDVNVSIFDVQVQ